MTVAEPVLKGQLAVVTGAGRGLGLATAKLLARMGAKAVVLDVNMEIVSDAVRQVEAEGGVAVGYELDVTDTTVIGQFRDRLMKEHGPVDILVNNAGITGDALVHKMDAETFERVLRINLGGSTWTTEAFLPDMMQKGYGRVVFLSSRAYLGNVGQANYTASKGGVVGYARSLALAHRKTGVTFNCIAPGLIKSRLTDAIPDHVRNRFIEAIPVGRIGQPEDIAHAIAFLVHPASDFITGQVINVCGGRSTGAPIA